jgi:hypothetical protein
LWQLKQLPVTPLWSNAAPIHDVVVWQSSQKLLDAMWVADLPVAVLPLWQLKQDPRTAACSTRTTGRQAVVE